MDELMEKADCPMGLANLRSRFIAGTDVSERLDLYLV